MIRAVDGLVELANDAELFCSNKWIDFYRTCHVFPIRVTRLLHCTAPQRIHSIPAPVTARSPLVAFGDLKVAGGDLLEGAGIGTFAFFGSPLPGR